MHCYADPIWTYLQQRLDRDDADSLSDVTDGCKEFLTKPEHMSLLLNTDSVSLFKSSTVSRWPIWLAVNELLPHVRYRGSDAFFNSVYIYSHIHVCTYQCISLYLFQKHNLLLAGLWCGTKKPTMTTFLASFVKEINKRSCNGGFHILYMMCGLTCVFMVSMYSTRQKTVHSTGPRSKKTGNERDMNGFRMGSPFPFNCPFPFSNPV